MSQITMNQVISSVLTVTPNPALDRTIELEQMHLNTINRAKASQMSLGGKGINVARALLHLGGRPVATGFLAGKTGQWACEMMEESHLLNDFVICDGQTRINTKIVETKSGHCTDINELGPAISAVEWQALQDKIFSFCQKNPGALVVLAGSLPPGLTRQAYADLLTSLRHQTPKVRVLLDSSDEYLRKALPEHPYLIKPNLDEFIELTAVDLLDSEGKPNLKLIEKEAKKLIDQNFVEVIVISLGKDGVLWVARNSPTYFVIPPKVAVKSTVGAGDSLLGAIAYGLSQEMALEEMLILACALGAAAVTTSGTYLPEMDLILKLRSQVRLQVFS